jgi:hypothetical protein
MTRDAFAERHARPPDLEPVEAVRRRQRQVRSVPIQQVERGDIGMERIARPVNHRLQQLVHVRAVVASRATSWRKRTWASWSEPGSVSIGSSVLGAIVITIQG